MKARLLLATVMLGALAIGGRLGMAANEPEQAEPRAVAVPNVVPLKLGSSIPLSVQSAGVTWKGGTYQVVRLCTIKFDLDKNDRLTADIQAGLTGFDNADYDIGGVVFQGKWHSG